MEKTDRTGGMISYLTVIITGDYFSRAFWPAVEMDSQSTEPELKLKWSDDHCTEQGLTGAPEGRHD